MLAFPTPLCPPLPVLNASHSAFNRRLGAGSPCSLCSVYKRPDDHVYAFSEATTCCCKSESISSCLCSMYFQYLVTTSGWTICCFLSCGNLNSHKGMFPVLSLGVCESKQGVYRWEITVISFACCWLAHLSLICFSGKDLKINHCCEGHTDPQHLRTLASMWGL